MSNKEKISVKDREILRELAEEQAKIASLPVHKDKIEMWKRLNGRESVRPMVWINEVPWHEMGVNGELRLRCECEFARNIEQSFRRLLYQWKYFPADMIVEDRFYSALCIKDTGFGIKEDAERLSTSENSVQSRAFSPQITCEADIEKIKMPEISLDREESEENLELLKECFGDILAVEKYGIGHQWFTLWDPLICWYGVEQAMLDLVLKPDLVHAALQRLLDAFLYRLKQYEELNILELNNGNFRIGSGGLGYTDELPQKDFNPQRIRTEDQ